MITGNKKFGWHYYLGEIASVSLFNISSTYYMPGSVLHRKSCKRSTMYSKGNERKAEERTHVEKCKLFRIALEWSKYGRVAEKEAGKVSWGPTIKRA